MGTSTVTIGEFSRLTHLSVKTLHHYHDVGLLSPATVDGATGYRRYSPEQARQAHLIRRLRDMGMPVPTVRALVTSEDPAVRDDILRGHLTQMQAELRRTQEVVSSLEAILRPAGRAGVTYRTLPPTPALALHGDVARTEIEEWCTAGIARLYRTAVLTDVEPNGAPGGAFSLAYFENDGGPVSVYLPVSSDTELPGEVDTETLPSGTFAVATHAGGFADFDRTYADLGQHVAEHDVALPDPIREHYLINRADSSVQADWRTEVFWPIAGPAVDLEKSV